MHATTDAHVDPELPVALLGIARQLRACAMATGEDFWMVVLLRYVLANEPLRLSALATCVGLDASTVSRQVKQLEDAGHVTRTEDADDRRACQLVATSSGRALVDRAMASHAAVVAAAVEDWSHEDRARLTALVKRLAVALERVAVKRELHANDPRG